MEPDNHIDTDHKGLGTSETLDMQSPTFRLLLPESSVDQEQNYSLVPYSALPEEKNPGAGEGQCKLSNSPAYPLSPTSPIRQFVFKEEEERGSDEGGQQEETQEGCNYKPRGLDWPVREQVYWPMVSKYLAYGSAKYRPMPTGVGPGLRNLGYTCFLNATMQCLTHTVPFVYGLALSKHPNLCDRAMEGFCVFCALRDHMRRAMCSSGGVISPIKLVENINRISPYFVRDQQEDAHEFQHALLDKLESCCFSGQQMDDNASRGSNMVDQIFGGRLVSEVRCCGCGHCTQTYETFIDLSLEIERADTLHTALECFTDVERMDDFRCENCNQKVTIEKHFLLDKRPMIAALHLKRFKSDGFNVEKIDKHVSFPLELDLHPFSFGSRSCDVESKYYLYGVVVHAGISPTSGHYFSFIRSSPNAWHGFDDSRVCEVPENDVLSQSAYILFYARQDVPWFSSVMEVPKQGLDLKDGSPTSVLDIGSVATSPTVLENDSTYSVMETPMPSLPTTGCSSDKGDIGDSADAAEERKNMDGLADELMLDDQLTAESINLFDGTSCSNARGPKPSSGGGNIIDNQDNDCGKLDTFSPLTPTKSHSPEYTNASGGKYSGVNNGISISDVKRELLSCKRQLNNELLDSKRREAIRNVKGMPNGRAASLLLLLRDPPGSNKKAKRTVRESQCKRATTPSSSQKSRDTDFMVPGRIH